MVVILGVDGKPWEHLVVRAQHMKQRELVAVAGPLLSTGLVEDGAQHAAFLGVRR